MASYIVRTNSDYQVETINFQPIKEDDTIKQKLDKAINTVFRALEMQGIIIANYINSIIKVDIEETTTGIDFLSKNTSGLLQQVKHRPTVFHYDDPDTISGMFMALATRGKGFRQVSPGPALHLEIDEPNNWCNVHIDSHGFVDGGGYNCDRMLAHGVWDLIPSYVPWAYFSRGSAVFNPYFGGLTLNIPLLGKALGGSSEFSTNPRMMPRNSSDWYALIGPGGHLERGRFTIDASMTWLRLDSEGANIEFEARASVAAKVGPFNARLLDIYNFSSDTQEIQGELRLDLKGINLSAQRDLMRGDWKASGGVSIGGARLEVYTGDSGGSGMSLSGSW